MPMLPKRIAFGNDAQVSRSRNSVRLIFAAVVIIGLLPSNATARLDIRSSQDGFGYSQINAYNSKIDATNPQTLNSWPSSTNVPVGAAGSYAGGVFDGLYYWLVPYSANHILRVHRTTGVMDAYASWPGGFTLAASGAFSGGIYDGARVWLVPAAQRAVVSIQIDTKVIQQIVLPSIASLASSAVAFNGAAYDRTQYMWMAPFDSPSVVRIDCVFSNVAVYASWPAGFTKSTSAFSGAVYFSESTVSGVTASPVVVLVPYNAATPVMIDTSSGTMTTLAWPSGFTTTAGAFFGGVNDGRGGVWFIPYQSASVVRFDLNSLPTVTSKSFAVWPSLYVKAGNAFRGGVFDGKLIWMIPADSPSIVTISVYTGLMSAVSPVTSFPAGFVKTPAAFLGGIYDGQGFAMIPYAADRIIQYVGTSGTGSMSKTVMMTFSRAMSQATKSLPSPSSTSSWQNSKSESYSLSASSSVSLSDDMSHSAKSVSLSPSDSSVASGSDSVTTTLTTTVRVTRSSLSKTSSGTEIPKSGSESETPSGTSEPSSSSSESPSDTQTPSPTRSVSSIQSSSLTLSRSESISQGQSVTFDSPSLSRTSSTSDSLAASESSSRSVSESSVVSSSDTISDTATETYTLTPTISTTDSPSASETLSSSLSLSYSQQVGSSTRSETTTVSSDRSLSRSISPSASLTPSSTPSPTATPTLTNSPSTTDSSSSEPSWSATLTPSPTSEASPTQSASPTHSMSSSSERPSPTVTLWLTETFSKTRTLTRTSSVTITSQVTFSASVTRSRSQTSPRRSETLSPSASVIPTPSHTPVATPTTSYFASETLSSSRTITPTQSASLTCSSTQDSSSSRSTSSTVSGLTPSLTAGVSVTFRTPSPSQSANPASASTTESPSLSTSMTPSPTNSDSVTNSVDSLSRSPTDELSRSPTTSASPSVTSSPSSEMSRTDGSASVSSTIMFSESFSDSSSLTVSETVTNQVTVTRSRSWSRLSNTSGFTGTVSVSLEVTSTKSPSVDRREQPSRTQLRSFSLTATDEKTATFSLLPTVTPTMTPSPSPSLSPSPTASVTPSQSNPGSGSESQSAHVTSTVTLLPTMTTSLQPTLTQVMIATPTVTFSDTPSCSPSPSVSVTPLPTLSPTELETSTETVTTSLSMEPQTSEVTATTTATSTLSGDGGSQSVSKSPTKSALPRNIDLGNIGGFVGAAQSTSTFLNGASECYGIVVAAVLPVIFWLVVVVLWRCVADSPESSAFCCRVAAHDVTDDTIPLDDDDDDDDDDEHHEGDSDDGKRGPPKAASRKYQRQAPISDKRRSQENAPSRPHAARTFFSKWFRVVVSEHVYLGAVFPCNAICCVLHPLELLAHILVVVTIYAALCVAFAAEFAAMRLLLGAIATLCACFVHVTVNALLSRWIGRGHDNRHWVTSFARVVVEWTKVVVGNTKDQGDADRVMTTIVEMLDLDEAHDDVNIAAIQNNGQQRRRPSSLPPPSQPFEQLHNSSVGDIDVEEIMWDELPSSLNDDDPPASQPPLPSGLGDYVTWLATEAMAADDVYDIDGDVTTDTIATAKVSSASGRKLAGNLKIENSLFTEASSSTSSDASSTLSWARPNQPELGAMIAFAFEEHDDPIPSKTPTLPPKPRHHTPPPLQRKRSLLEVRKDVIQMFAGAPAPPRTPTPPTPPSPAQVPIAEANELLRVVAAYRAWERRCRLFNLPVLPWWAVDVAVRRRYMLARCVLVACWVAASFSVVHYALQARVGVNACTNQLATDLPIVLIVFDGSITQSVCATLLVAGWRKWR